MESSEEKLQYLEENQKLKDKIQKLEKKLKRNEKEIKKLKHQNKKFDYYVENHELKLTLITQILKSLHEEKEKVF